MPPKTALDPNQQATLATVRHFGAARTAARNQHTETAAQFRAAILAAAHVVEPVADITAAAGKAVTRQTVHLTVKRADDTAPRTCWENAGKPDREAALAAVTAAAEPYRRTRRGLAEAEEMLFTHMLWAVRRDIPATAIVEASGYASQSGHDHVTYLQELHAVQRALEAAGLGDDVDNDDRVLVSSTTNPQRQIKVIVGADAERPVSVARRAVAALAAAGFTVRHADMFEGGEYGTVIRSAE